MTAAATDLLRQLVSIPSTSRDEGATALLIERYLADRGCEVGRVYNNVWTLAAPYDPSRPTLMLNSHHDTVKPSPSYTRDPYCSGDDEGIVYGLGSNDAGGSLVSLIEAFLRLKDVPLPFNLLLAISAEEEVGGEHGMRALLPALAHAGINVDMAIVGEPTGMQPAVAERGLVVLDCVARGVTGHAARDEGVNALYKAIDDINRLRRFQPEKVSPVLGPIKISVTMIEAGRAHNVVPEECRYVVDVRTTDAYTNEATVELLRSVAVNSQIQERSTRVRASVIDSGHPLVKAAVALGGTPMVSPTTSDMSLMHDFPSLKIGPGDSARSHAADEFILVDEIARAIDFYTQLIITLDI